MQEACKTHLLLSALIASPFNRRLLSAESSVPVEAFSVVMVLAVWRVIDLSEGALPVSTAEELTIDGRIAWSNRRCRSHRIARRGKDSNIGELCWTDVAAG